MSATTLFGTGSLLIGELLQGYRAGRYTPVDVMTQVLERLAASAQPQAWIAKVAPERVLAQAQELLTRSPQDLPLYGIPFAIKDNIDLAGLPTTAGCPAYAYEPTASAAVVARLIAAGAVPIGKTNLDQFATGLVGTRSPYGACSNSFDDRYISGGSSSGSAIAVATGLVSFALGTDTAGSGRVPAAFNNLVGFKPSCGRLSTRGVVPACRTLDCVSIFTLTASDAARVLGVAEGYDALDPYSRDRSRGMPASGPQSAQVFRFAVPRDEQLEFFGDTEAARLFAAAVQRLEALGGKRVEIDFTAFAATARLLYEGPWVAERYAAIEAFMAAHASDMLEVTREIIAGGGKPTAAAAFQAQYRLQALRRETADTWRSADVLLLPTAGTIYTLAQVAAEPLRLNSNLGIYTNFVNLLDLAAVSVPAGFRADGLPFGVSLIAPAGSDGRLLGLAARLQRVAALPLGALKLPLPVEFDELPTTKSSTIPVVVCGAHMTGLPLNHQLTERGAQLLRIARTAPLYAFYALAGGPPRRPGLVRVGSGGAAIEVEVWEVPAAEFGSFVAGIPAPLAIGKVQLLDGSLVSGFVCETYGVEGATDITSLGGWRRYLQTVP